MAGCTRLFTGIPNPLPALPTFLYMDKDGKPVPPPNYVPNLNDCQDSGCGCGCSGGSGSSGGCGCSGAGASSPTAIGCAAEDHCRLSRNDYALAA